MTNRKKFSGKTWIATALMILGITVAVMARNWPFRTALFPVAIGIVVALMALADILLGLFGKADGKKHTALGTKLTHEVDQETAFRRTVSIFLWIFGFFLMIVFLGFNVAVPLLVFLYLKVQSSEGWALSLSLTAATMIFVYGLFVWMLGTPFPQGWIFRWAEAISLG